MSDLKISLEYVLRMKSVNINRFIFMVAVKAFTERPGKSVADLSKENRLKCYYGWTEKGQDPRVNVLTA